MRRRLMMFGLFAAALLPWLAQSSPVSAQDAKADGIEKLAFKTHDEVTIQGVLYTSSKGANSPTVLMMHSYGVDPNKGDWSGLAKTLAAEGFNVLRFDFRGHGDSKIVNSTKFWADPINAGLLRTLARRQPDTVDVKGFPPRDGGDYFYRLADDIMAARVALDQLNDNSKVNTRSVYLVGSTDAVEVGLLYLTAEWSRPQKMPPFLVGMGPMVLSPPQPNGLVTEPAAIDVAGAVWLSPKLHSAASQRLIPLWVQQAPELRERTPMLFIFGEKDRVGRRTTGFMMDGVLVAGGNPRGNLSKLPLTYVRTVKDTNLEGVELLGKNLGTEAMIVDYLKTVEKERTNLIRVTNRAFSTPPAINLAQFNVFK